LESGVTFARVSNGVAGKADNTAVLNARRGKVEAKIDAADTHGPGLDGVAMLQTSQYE
jgi:hypothetical protein